MSRFSFDTDPHPVFSTYSAANFGEVAPERLSIMSWSLMGDPVERGCRALVRRFWPRATWHTGSHYTFVGYFACRPYHNLSAFCQMSRDAPIVSGEDVAASYFEDTPQPSLPKGLALGRVMRSAGAWRMARELVRVRPRLMLADGRVTALEDGARALRHDGGCLLLGQLLAEARAVLDEVWDLHYTTTSIVLPVHALQRRVGERTVDYWHELEPWLNRPEELVWASLHDAAEHVGSGEFLGRAFYEIADDHFPWETRARRSVAHGCIDEAQGDRELARVAWDLVPGARLVLLPQLTRLVVDAMTSREASKSLAMRTMHVFRVLMPGLAAAAGVAESHWPYLTIGELAGGQRPEILARLTSDRREECLCALDQPAPDLFTAGGSTDATPSPPAPRRGRGVSPGVARGIVVTPAEPNGVDGPRILVCETADADLQPLLPTVAGVMTARGSVLSHVTILAREYGIPAVVGHNLALRLKPGQRVELNGTTGEVTLLD